ncbi:NAD-dependent epimerase/dehydratase family protein, partial [Arthrospira platensis SPKY2]
RQDPGSPYSGVISIFANRILSGEKITIFGDGEQTRDFIYVDDVVRYLIVALNHASYAAPVFNVCTGKGTSINQLAQTAIKVAKKAVGIEYKPAREGDICYSVGKPEIANDTFNLSAKVDLESGLKKLFYTL